MGQKTFVGFLTRQNLEGLEPSEVRGCDRRRQCALIIFTFTMCADCEQAHGGWVFISSLWSASDGWRQMSESCWGPSEPGLQVQTSRGYLHLFLFRAAGKVVIGQRSPAFTRLFPIF